MLHSYWFLSTKLLSKRLQLFVFLTPWLFMFCRTIIPIDNRSFFTIFLTFYNPTKVHYFYSISVYSVLQFSLFFSFIHFLFLLSSAVNTTFLSLSNIHSFTFFSFFSSFFTTNIFFILFLNPIFRFTRISFLCGFLK